MTRQSAPPLTGIALLVHDCGLTPQQVMAAIEDNRANVTARMRSYGHPDAVEEVMCDLMEQTLTALRRWRNYEDRRPLAALVNHLVAPTCAEWMDRSRPKHRVGMTHSPSRKAGRRPAPSDPEDIPAQRAWLARELGDMAGDRYVIAGDIAQGGEGPDGRATASPEERASFTAWTIGPDDDPFDGLQYAPDLDALRDRVRALYGNDAWPRLLSRAQSSRNSPTGSSPTTQASTPIRPPTRTSHAPLAVPPRPEPHAHDEGTHDHEHLKKNEHSRRGRHRGMQAPSTAPPAPHGRPSTRPRDQTAPVHGRLGVRANQRQTRHPRRPARPRQNGTSGIMARPGRDMAERGTTMIGNAELAELLAATPRDGSQDFYVSAMAGLPMSRVSAIRRDSGLGLDPSSRTVLHASQHGEGPRRGHATRCGGKDGR